MEQKKKDIIQLSDHFGYSRLMRFTFPSIVMMIFTSIYGVVDGLFVSNLVGKTSFAAVNFIMPLLMILGSLGFMFGAGGSALVAKTLGEGQKEKAQKIFSLLVYFAAALGVVIAVPVFFLLRPIVSLMGAEGELLDMCVIYGSILTPALPFLILQFAFQSFFITAEKPQIGLLATVAAGVMNIVLDALFMAVFDWGLVGAALASAMSQLTGAMIALIYFARHNTSLLRLCRTEFDGRAILKTCANGSSELMSNISLSIVSMLYNMQLMTFAGENGVAAYGVIMYVNLVFLAIFIGYSTGMAPVVGYHYGALNQDELKSLLKKSMVILSVSAVAMFALSLILARPLSALFVGYDDELMELTCHAFFIYAFSFLFSGFSIFGSAFFTALNDGLTSALISFLRSLIFQVAAVLILPMIFGLDGIWYSIVAAEVVSVAVTAAFVIGKRKKYNYI